MAKTKVFLAETPCYDFLCSIMRLHNNRELTADRKANPDIQKWVQQYAGTLPDWVRQTAGGFFNTETSFGLMLCGLVGVSDAETVPELIAYLETIPAADLLTRLLSSGGGLGADVTPHLIKQLQTDQAAALRFVQTEMPFNPEDKWRVLEYLLQPEQTKGSLIQLLSWHYEHVYRHDESRVVALLQKASQDLRERLRYDEEYLRLMIPYDRSRPPKALTIALSYYYETEIFYDVMDAVYLFGFRFHEDIERRHSVLAGVQVFKALADETRLQILKLLLQRSWYGHEIAQQLSISNSTISHHVSILAHCGMVRAFKQENRVYYQLDTAETKRVVSDALDRILAD